MNPRSRFPVLAPRRRIEVFAADAVSAQLVIRSDADRVEITHRGDLTAHTADGGAVITTVNGLDPDTAVPVSIRDADESSTLEVRTRTDIGPIRTRVATISDVHLGLDRFGLANRVRERKPGADPYPERCARAAVAEAIAWGADVLVIKGDLTENGTTPQWDIAAGIFGDLPIPVLFTPGNHDRHRDADVSAEEGARRMGLEIAPVQIHDRPGVRIVLADTSAPGRGSGAIGHRADEILEAVADSTMPVLLFTHHHIQRYPIPFFWPPGIRASDGAGLLEGLRTSSTPVLMSSGHTHRNRSDTDRRGTLVTTEVSSTSDHPGVWAGYEVSERAIRQTVRRIADPDALSWLVRTERAVGGLWPRWSQGLLEDRCVDLRVG